jgi:hypothetical protein
VVDSNIVFSHALKVIARFESCWICMLNSNVHETWARKYSSTLETRLRYLAFDAFETYPFPNRMDSCNELGAQFLDARTKLMRGLGVGLTRLYNKIHNPSEMEAEICKFRDLIVRVDTAVARLHGWDNLSLDHDFHSVTYLPEGDRLRFTISEEARHDILARLADLNRERYQQELKTGIHGPAAHLSPVPIRSRKKRAARLPSDDHESAAPFDQQ